MYVYIIYMYCMYTYYTYIHVIYILYNLYIYISLTTQKAECEKISLDPIWTPRSQTVSSSVFSHRNVSSRLHLVSSDENLVQAIPRDRIKADLLKKNLHQNCIINSCLWFPPFFWVVGGSRGTRNNFFHD